MDIERHLPGPHDVQIEIAYCGICYSDLHTVRSEWAGMLYPCMPDPCVRFVIDNASLAAR